MSNHHIAFLKIMQFVCQSFLNNAGKNFFKCGLVIGPKRSLPLAYFCLLINYPTSQCLFPSYFFQEGDKLVSENYSYGPQKFHGHFLQNF
jgi:hypothetical protein